MGRGSIPTNWPELDLIPHGHVVRGEDVHIKMGPHIRGMANAMIGASERTCTKILQVLKELLVAIGVQYYPYNATALRDRLGRREYVEDKVSRKCHLL